MEWGCIQIISESNTSHTKSYVWLANDLNYRYKRLSICVSAAVPAPVFSVTSCNTLLFSDFQQFIPYSTRKLLKRKQFFEKMLITFHFYVCVCLCLFIYNIATSYKNWIWFLFWLSLARKMRFYFHVALFACFIQFIKWKLVHYCLTIVHSSPLSTVMTCF